ncbi:MAG: DUF885 domain-containing protein [Thermoanaerobaculia bacterium]
MNQTSASRLLLRAVPLALFLSASLSFAAVRPVPTKASPKKAVPSAPGGFPALRDRYVHTFLVRFPVVATYLGAEGLDPALGSLNGKLRDLSPAALRIERQEWLDFRSALGRVDRSKLTPAERIDAEVMQAQLAFLLHNLDRNTHERALDAFVEEPFRGVEWLLQGMTPTGAETTGTRKEWEQTADRIAATPAYLRVALANIRRGSAAAAIPDRRMIRVTIDGAASTIEYFDKSLPKKAGAWMLPADAATLTRLEEASRTAARAYTEFRQGLMELFLEKDGKTLKPGFDRDRFALGEVEYVWALENNLRETRRPRELHTYGKSRVAETLTAMTVLARAIAASHSYPDSSLPSVFAKLSDDVPKSDDEMLSWYKDACQRLVAYGRKTGMFELPADYKLDVVFTPPPLRDTTTAAYYPAPPFKKTGVGQFYVTPTGDDPVALREAARATIADLAAHEGFPGHDWYYQFMRSRAKSISPVRWLLPGGVEDSASMWEDSMSGEGWALYCEQLMGEPRAGFPNGFYTPEERLFMLQNQLYRDARVVVDTGIHCGYMTFDEAVAYFARNVFFVKGPISSEAKGNPDPNERRSVESSRKDMYRYSKWPTQAITYHLGKAAIIALRSEMQRLEGSNFDERRFHEAFLMQGTIPPGYFAETLRGAALPRENSNRAPQ